MNEDEIFFLRGFYSNLNGIIEVWVLNLMDETKPVLGRMKIGKCIRADSSPLHDASQDKRVHTLGHQPIESLSAAELQEQRDFLKQQLELDKNKLLTSRQHDRVLQVFLDNFDAVSVCGEDFGCSDLVTFHIQLKPGSKPHRAKCRPLNPLQEEDLKRQLN